MEGGTPKAREFRDELYALIDRYREGPLDDRLCYGDFVQVMDFAKFELILEAVHADMEDETI